MSPQNISVSLSHCKLQNNSTHLHAHCSAVKSSPKQLVHWYNVSQADLLFIRKMTAGNVGGHTQTASLLYLNHCGYVNVFTSFIRWRYLLLMCFSLRYAWMLQWQHLIEMTPFFFPFLLFPILLCPCGCSVCVMLLCRHIPLWPVPAPPQNSAVKREGKERGTECRAHTGSNDKRRDVKRGWPSELTTPVMPWKCWWPPRRW